METTWFLAKLYAGLASEYGKYKYKRKEKQKEI